MTSGLRILATVVAFGASMFAALIVSGAAGLDRLPFVQIPTSVFVALLTVWPIAVKPLEQEKGRSFTDYAAFNAALMLVFGLLMWSVGAWTSARRLIEQYSR